MTDRCRARPGWSPASCCTTLCDAPLRVLERATQDHRLRTHGIEESLLLADRVVVMTYRPGTVKRVVPIALSRPRDPGSADFNRLEAELTALVMEEEEERH